MFFWLSFHEKKRTLIHGHKNVVWLNISAHVKMQFMNNIRAMTKWDVQLWIKSSGKTLRHCQNKFPCKFEVMMTIKKFDEMMNKTVLWKRSLRIVLISKKQRQRKSCAEANKLCRSRQNSIKSKKFNCPKAWV